MKTKVGTTICTLDDLTFPVELRDNPRNTNREYSKVITGIINGEEVDLNYCSPVYELVPCADIFPKVEEILNRKGIAFSVNYSHTQHARFYGNFIIEDPRFAYRMQGTNDFIKFIWNFQHSYNGLTKYKGIAGFHRLVCTNGLTVPIAEMKEYNLCIEGKHTNAIIHSLLEFENILVNVTNNLNVVKTAITAKYELLGGRWVANPADRVKEVLNATGIIVIEQKYFDTVNKVLSLIDAEVNPTGNKLDMGYKGRVNDWLIYNGINQYINDGRNIVSPEKRRETDSKVLEYMLEYA